MAVSYPITNGAWSNTGIWYNGVVPGAGDDVFASGQTVYLDQDITVSSLRNYPSGTMANGGTFSLSGCNVINGDLIYGGTNSTLVTVPVGVDANLTVSGDIYCGYNTNSTIDGIKWQNPTGTLNVIGDIYHSNDPSFATSQSSSNFARSVYFHNLGPNNLVNVAVTGNIQGGNNNAVGIWVEDSRVNLDITGNVQGGKHLSNSRNGSNSYGIYYLSASGNISVNGDLIAGGPYNYYYSYAIFHSNSSGNIDIVGDLYGINGGYVNDYGLLINGSASENVNITGNIYARGYYDNNPNVNLTITGNVYGSTSVKQGTSSRSSSNSIQLTGNAYGGEYVNSNGMNIYSTGVFTLIGNSYGGTSYVNVYRNHGILMHGYDLGTVNIIGNLKAGNGTSWNANDNTHLQSSNSHGLALVDPKDVVISGDVINDLSPATLGQVTNHCFTFYSSTIAPKTLTIHGDVVGSKYGRYMYGFWLDDNNHSVDVTINGDLKTEAYVSNSEVYNHAARIIYGNVGSSTGVNININGNLIPSGSYASSCLLERHNADNKVNLNISGAINNFNLAVGNGGTLDISQPYNFVINQDLYNNVSSAGNGHPMLNIYGGSGTTTVNGNLYSYNETSSTTNHVIKQERTTAGKLIINGNMYSSGNAALVYSYYNYNNPDLHVNGNIYDSSQQGGSIYYREQTNTNIYVSGDIHVANKLGYRGVIYDYYGYNGSYGFGGDLYTDGSDYIIGPYQVPAAGHKLKFRGNIYRTGNVGTREVFRMNSLYSGDITVLNTWSGCDFGLLYVGGSATAASFRTVNISGVFVGSPSQNVNTILIVTNSSFETNINLYGDYYPPEYYTNSHYNTTIHANVCGNTNLNVYGTIHGAGPDRKCPVYLGSSNSDTTFKANFKKIIAPSGYWPIYQYDYNTMKPWRIMNIIDHDGPIISTTDSSEFAVNLVTSSFAADFPPASTVQSGVYYDNTLKVGTLALPSPNQVAVGVPVGTGVGVAVLTADAMLAGLGMASGNLDSQLQNINVTSMTEGAVEDIFSTYTIGESYAASGSAGTPAQIMYLTQQAFTDFDVTGTSIKVRKIDGSGIAATYSMDDASTPTSRTRST